MPVPSIPNELRALIHGYDFVQETIGKSGDTVFRLERRNCPSLIAKVSGRTTRARLREEAARLKWLGASGILAPRVLHLSSSDVHDWLVMDCLPGTNAAVANDSPAIVVRQVAEALAGLHALNPNTCPFDETLVAKFARAEANIQMGLVDEGDFDDEHRGKTANALFHELRLLRPDSEDIVVAHGDATLPNMMIEAGRFSGFVDCGKAGRCDRYQDISLACRSIKINLGAVWIAPFLQAYGLNSIDEQRSRFYRMLDEFF
jgi:aminoglycoside 3'-phosphotransferase II